MREEGKRRLCKNKNKSSNRLKITTGSKFYFLHFYICREKPMYLPFPRLTEDEVEDVIPPPEVVL
jgi:hypothetical protein